MEKKKGLIAEFREFITRGSVMDMAVGIIMGSAFTAIVNSLVNDILMPLIGSVIGKINFTDLKVVVSPATDTAAEVALCYGAFIQNIINFLLIALVIFLMVKGINRFHRKKEEAPPAPPEPSDEVVLLTQIRDALQENKKD
jgi:large conductance mechanosensitive channel